MASNPALCPPDTTSLANGAAASSSSGRSAYHPGRPRRTTGTRGSAAARKSGEFVRIAADRLQKVDDPEFVGGVLVPYAADLVNERSPAGVVLT